MDEKPRKFFMEIKHEVLEDTSSVMIVSLSYNLDDEVQQLKKMIDQFITNTGENVILIFNNTNTMGSSVMGLFFQLADKFRGQNGNLYFVCLPEKLLSLFAILDLLPLFKIFSSTKEAIKDILKK